MLLNQLTFKLIIFSYILFYQNKLCFNQLIYIFSKEVDIIGH